MSRSFKKNPYEQDTAKKFTKDNEKKKRKLREKRRLNNDEPADKKENK